MGAADDPLLQAQPAPAGMPITIRSTVPAMKDGTLILARVDAPTLGIECAYLYLDPAANALGLLAGCGCTVHVSVSGLLLSLAQNIGQAHGPAPHARH